MTIVLFDQEGGMEGGGQGGGELTWDLCPLVDEGFPEAGM